MKAAEAKGRINEEIVRNANAAARRTAAVVARKLPSGDYAIACKKAAEKRMLEVDRTGIAAAFGENPEAPGNKANSQRPQNTDHPWSR